MIVVDTNIICYYFLKSSMSEIAEKVYEKDSFWVSPLLWRSEFRNVLAGYLRKEIIGINKALLISEGTENFMKGKEFEVSSLDVINLVSKSKCSAYDSEFVSLAKEFNIPLVTSDKRILREFPELAVNSEDFINE